MVKRMRQLIRQSCGFVTLEDEGYGSYPICDVCGWEDDGVQLANPTSSGGANGYSLAEAQTRAAVKFPPELLVIKKESRPKHVMAAINGFRNSKGEPNEGS